MIKSLAILIIIAFLAACSGGGGSDTETTTIKTEPLQTVIFYGDSIGKQLEESEDRPDFVYDTRPGRELMALTFEPESIRKNTVIDYNYDVIYIELGTNDRGNEVAAELHLIQLLEGYQDKIICVLPMTQRGEEIPFRLVMIEHCNNTIDPLAFGVYPLNDSDTVHLSDTDGGDNVRHYGSIF